MNELVSISNEPKEETYVQLLQFALRKDNLFSLVWRDQHKFHESGSAIEEKLRPNLILEMRTDEWPGTKLLGHLATVRLYQMSSEALAILAEAKKLYAWLTPDRPEDLAFYAGKDKPWMGSISHERDAFVYPQSVDIEQLRREIPGLSLEHIQP